MAKLSWGFIGPVVLFSLLSACAYRWGFTDRKLPGSYDQVAVPIFENKSEEVGIEVDFTNAFVNRMERSKAAHIVDKNMAPAVIEGSIERVLVTLGPGVTGVGKDNKDANKEIPNLPEQAVLSTEYHVVVYAKIILRRTSDQSVLWQSAFSGEKSYQGPRIGTPIVNSANALYNQSARRDTIRQLAEDMMTEAHNRMTENF